MSKRKKLEKNAAIKLVDLNTNKYISYVIYYIDSDGTRVLAGITSTYDEAIKYIHNKNINITKSIIHLFTRLN